MTIGGRSRVIVCQIGAREHYAVPRTLHQAGLLAELITDIWVQPGSALSYLPGSAGERLRGRYHPDLSDARVTHFTKKALGREVLKAASKSQPRWDELLSANRWFQTETVRHLRTSEALKGEGVKPVVLAYSYAAREILALTHSAGARTMLAQIDGGEADEALIASLWAEREAIMQDKAPSTYWKAWRDECRIADRILVNSEWSQRLLGRAGVETRKLILVPVIYGHSRSTNLTAHQYPTAFDSKRPLAVLFVGALTLRKGVLETLNAARAMAESSVHFTLVGADPEGHGAQMGREANITWHDRVPRSRVLQFYREADVFLFPTHSDGFGMAQIEALESGLPVIASQNCAEIVEHCRTGLLLEEVSSDAIVSAISFCLHHPEKLVAMSAAALAAGADYGRRSANAFLDAIQALTTLEPA